MAKRSSLPKLQSILTCPCSFLSSCRLLPYQTLAKPTPANRKQADDDDTSIGDRRRRKQNFSYSFLFFFFAGCCSRVPSTFAPPLLPWLVIPKRRRLRRRRRSQVLFFSNATPSQVPNPLLLSQTASPSFLWNYCQRGLKTAAVEFSSSSFFSSLPKRVGAATAATMKRARGKEK